jgi:outer membrane protein assembly factor BamA
MKQPIIWILMASLTSLFLINGHVFAAETHGRIQPSEKTYYAFDTTSDTKEGVVTLRGKTRNAADMDLVTHIASDINGVKKVINNITVEGNASTESDEIPKTVKGLKMIKVKKGLVAE